MKTLYKLTVLGKPLSEHLKSVLIDNTSFSEDNFLKIRHNAKTNTIFSYDFPEDVLIGVLDDFFKEFKLYRNIGGKRLKDNTLEWEQIYPTKANEPSGVKDLSNALFNMALLDKSERKAEMVKILPHFDSKDKFRVQLDKTLGKKGAKLVEDILINIYDKLPKGKPKKKEPKKATPKIETPKKETPKEEMTPKMLGNELKRIFKDKYSLNISTRYIKTTRSLDNSWYEISTWKTGTTIPNHLRKRFVELTYNIPISELNIGNLNAISYGNVSAHTISMYGKDWKKWINEQSQAPKKTKKPPQKRTTKSTKSLEDKIANLNF
jgi:hypothetical protein